MDTRKIGSLDVSVVGLGCNNFGMRIDEEATKAVVNAALDEGITLFDTADVYGGTRSEELLGKALGKHRSDVVIATKFGAPLDEERKGAKPGRPAPRYLAPASAANGGMRCVGDAATELANLIVVQVGDAQPCLLQLAPNVDGRLNGVDRTPDFDQHGVNQRVVESGGSVGRGLQQPVAQGLRLAQPQIKGEPRLGIEVVDLEIGHLVGGAHRSMASIAT